ncbi:MAG: hypothetical protein ABF780_07155 [Bifidobacterium aquikefiri]|uniref:CopG family transcriptional regulator n=1 Tax=Bifidobacterium aquikefiri TaxID=1653207 RepID=A0A261G6Z9_9BIFI|nr:hypothetical protein [Bifidobacterium aquikefiri]OZG66965.1 CopG family transcriptional regulator [Bifidobacterium aquikefiri]
MNSTIYENAPRDIAEAIEHSVEVDDFLPQPNELLGKINKKRITITLSERSIERFKDFAKKHDTKYQTLISEVVDAYSARLQ